MTARILQPTAEAIAKAARALAADDVVGMPTETVYGLAGNAFSPSALARIFSTKERPTFDPLIVHVAREFELAELADLERLSKPARESARKLTEALWPGPLTVVLPKKPSVPDLATSGLDTVAIRMPAHPVAQRLLKETGFPLAAPSANRFGRISPTSAEAVREELGERIALILDGGPCAIGLESTVVAFDEEGGVKLLRPGFADNAQLERLTGRKVTAASAMKDGAQPAPGMLASHYAPRAKLVLLPSPARELGKLTAPAGPLGLLAFAGDAREAARALAQALGEEPGARRISVRVLSPGGDLAEAARNLFASLRELDSESPALIYAEPCPSRDGLGFAIADRLGRAAH